VSAQPAPAPRYRGPSAFGDDVRRFASLTWMLASTDFKLTFFGSALGYLWTLTRPLLLFGMLYVIFTEVVNLGADVKHYGVYLLTGLVLFGFFSETTSRAVDSLVERENLLRKMRFPRMVIPLSVALRAAFNLGLNLIVVMAFVFGNGIEPRLDWLQLPLLLAMLAALTLGVAMLISALYVRFRDMKPIWEVSLQLAFYGSPLLYTVGQMPQDFQEFEVLNPIAVVMTQLRHAVIDPEAPTAATVFGGELRLLAPLAIVAAVFALGAWVFAREAPRIAENL
jgi:ABC-2 type transport system permease protein